MGPRSVCRLAGLVVALLLVGCADGTADEEPGPIGGEAAAEDATSEDDDDDDEGDVSEDEDAAEADDELAEYAAPDDLDELDSSYLDAVLDRMQEGLISPGRAALHEGEVTPELRDALAAVYSEDEAEFQEVGWESWITGEFDGTEVAQPAADLEARRHRSTPRVTSPECIFAQVEVDYSPFFGEQREPRSYHVALVPGEPAPPINPTPWRINLEGQGEADPSWCDR